MGTAPAMTDGPSEEDARPLLRFGWMAKGLLFVIIGLLSLELARRGNASEEADQKGALEALAGAPVGRAAVFAVSIGLLFYAAWQVWAAIVQDGDDETDVDDVIHQLTRIGWVGLAGLYAMLATTGIQIALDGESAASSESGGPTSPSGFTGRLLEWPGGRWLVAAVGVATIAVGLYQLRKGLGRDFLDDIDTSGLGSRARRILSVLGVTGFVARAVLMATGGWLLVDAALLRDPDRAAGLDDSLRALTDAPGGRWLLTAVGLGLISAGVYDAATFRRQRIDEAEEQRFERTGGG